MKKSSILFSAFLISFFTFAKSPNSRVLVIGIDGVRSEALTAADTPNIYALITNSFYSPNALNDIITISGPVWSNILCGVRSDKHLVERNDFSIYPNPATSEFTINSSSQIQRVDVYNPVGELVFSSITSANL